MTSKTRIAVALAAAFGTMATGAFAQSSTVQIGGSLNMFYSKSDPGGVQPGVQGKKHDNLSLSEPELFIAGEEKLGSGTAWFRCTSSFDLMGTSAANTTGAGQLCGRNSALGFKGSFGNVFAGTWDTPLKLVGGETRGWFGGTASLTGGFATVLLGGAGSNTGNTGATFWERRARSISFHSANYGGFNVKALYSAANEATGLITATMQQTSPRTLGLSAEYAQGPMYFGIGYEKHDDFNPAAATLGTGATQYMGRSDEAWLFAARYQLRDVRLSGLYTKTEHEVSNTANLKKDGFALFADWKVSGPHSVKAQYFKGGDSKGTAGAAAVGSHPAVGSSTGAKGWSLAYTHDLSKRTQVGFVYGLIDNDTNAAYGKGVSTATTGATQKVYGLNLRHRF